MLKELLENLGDEIEIDLIEKKVDQEKTEFDKVIQHLLMALEVYKLDIISYELHKLRESVDTRDLVFKVFLPLIQKIGQKVINNELSISQEHALTSILKFHLSSYVYRKNTGPKKKNKKIIFATPEGDLHEFGILLSSVIASYYGFEFYMLGPNLPIDSLAESMNALEADIIVVGTTYSPKGPKFEQYNAYFSELIEKLKLGQELWVGGTGNFALKDFKFSQNFNYIESLTQLDIKLQNL